MSPGQSPRWQGRKVSFFLPDRVELLRKLMFLAINSKVKKINQIKNLIYMHAIHNVLFALGACKHVALERGRSVKICLLNFVLFLKSK